MTSQATNEAQLVRYEVIEPHIAVVTLNRPEKRNAINAAMTQALEAALLRAERDFDVRVVLLASSDPRIFCAGADLAALAAGEAKSISTEAGGFAGFVRAAREKPWIAVVEGPALAGGFEICLACDMIVSSTAARFGIPEVKRGFLAGAGGVFRLPQRIPRNIALEFLATGEPMEAGRAHELGLVNRLAAPGQALEAARMLARAIIPNAPLAVYASLDIGRQSAGLSDAEGMRLTKEAIDRLSLTEDFHEGPRAFVEKRAAVWKGR